MSPRTEILIIEDDVELREAVKGVLELEGYQVACAAHGGEGLEILSQESPPGPHLILLDLMMPVMSGAEFLQRIRAREDWQSRIPVVVFSAAGNRLPELTGASQILKKPIELEDLLKIAQKYVSR
jgi:CheY-like chemotaxis protein